MKILVCMSRTPDTTSKISFVEKNMKFNEEGVQWIINPYDEWYALAKAIQIKEKMEADVKAINAHIKKVEKEIQDYIFDYPSIPEAEIRVIHLGYGESETLIRKALAIGADYATRIDSIVDDAAFIAHQIADVARDRYDLILTGKESIDSNGSSIGGMVAEILNINFISHATSLEIENNLSIVNKLGSFNDWKDKVLERDLAIVTRETEDGTEKVSATFPLVVSCQKGMAEIRFPTLRGIMDARKKSLNVIEPIRAVSLTNIKSFELPPEKAGVKLIPADNPELLVKLLREEAKAI